VPTNQPRAEEATIEVEWRKQIYLFRISLEGRTSDSRGRLAKQGVSKCFKLSRCQEEKQRKNTLRRKVRRGRKART